MFTFASPASSTCSFGLLNLCAAVSVFLYYNFEGAVQFTHHKVLYGIFRRCFVPRDFSLWLFLFSFLPFSETENPWKAKFGQDDGEEISTKLMLAAIESLRAQLDKEVCPVPGCHPSRLLFPPILPVSWFLVGLLLAFFFFFFILQPLVLSCHDSSCD